MDPPSALEKTMKSRRKNKFDFESEEKRKKYLNEIIAFFLDERDEEIGVVAAEKVLEFFWQSLAEDIYKKAIIDMKSLLKEKVADLEIEFDLLSAK
jgi:uncharacterized protein (DUF2164 family)